MTLAGVDGKAVFANTLDESSFEGAAIDPEKFQAKKKAVTGGKIALKAYGVAWGVRERLNGLRRSSGARRDPAGQSLTAPRAVSPFGPATAPAQSSSVMNSDRRGLPFTARLMCPWPVVSSASSTSPVRRMRFVPSPTSISTEGASP